MTRLVFEGGWSLELPDSFQRIEREGGGLDATDGVRTIHLTSITIEPRTSALKPLPARDVHERRRPARTAYQLAGPADWGWAAIVEDDEGQHLQGTREAQGTILIVGINYTDPGEREWALNVWRAAHWSPRAV